MSNLLHHLSRKHVLEYQECMKLRSASSTSAGNVSTAREKSSQMSLKDAFARGTAYDKKSKRWIEITNAITIMAAAFVSFRLALGLGLQLPVPGE